MNLNIVPGAVAALESALSELMESSPAGFDELEGAAKRMVSCTLLSDRESGGHEPRIIPINILPREGAESMGQNPAAKYTEEILEVWRDITKRRGCAIVVLDMPLLDTRSVRSDITGTFISDIVLQLLSYVAQVERDNIRQRQAEGIAAAQARGVRFGRPPKRRPKSYASAKAAYLKGTITKKEASARLRVSPTTFDKWLAQDEEHR